MVMEAGSDADWGGTLDDWAVWAKDMGYEASIASPVPTGGGYVDPDVLSAITGQMGSYPAWAEITGVTPTGQPTLMSRLGDVDASIRRAQLAAQELYQQGQLEIARGNLDLGNRQLAQAQEQFQLSIQLEQQRVDIQDFTARAQALYQQGQLNIQQGNLDIGYAQLDESQRQFDLAHQLDQQRFGLESRVTMAQLAANPRDWIASAYATRGQTPQGVENMPWLQSILQNEPLPAFQGTQRPTGATPQLSTSPLENIPLVSPNQVSRSAYGALQPFEQQMLQGLSSAQGSDWPSFQQTMQKSWVPGSLPSTTALAQ
jgi:hypothetical protein